MGTRRIKIPKLKSPTIPKPKLLYCLCIAKWFHQPLQRITFVFFIMAVFLVYFTACSFSSHEVTTRSEIYMQHNIPTYDISHVALNVPVAGLFIGISNYNDQAGVWSTAAHALSASIFYEPFYRGKIRQQELKSNLKYFKNPGGLNLNVHGEVCSVAFHPKDVAFAIATEKSTSIWWLTEKENLDEAIDNNNLTEIPISQNEVKSVEFSPDGKSLVTASLDGSAVIWEASTGARIRTMSHPSPVIKASFDSMGKSIITTSKDNVARLWDAKVGEQPILAIQDSEHAQFISNDSKIVTINGCVVSIWSRENSLKPLYIYDQDTPVWDLEVSKNSHFVMTRNLDGIFVYEAAGKKEPIFIKTKLFELKSASISPDGNLVAAGFRDGTIKLFNISNIKSPVMLRDKPPIDPISRFNEAKDFFGDANSITRLQFGPDGKKLFAVNKKEIGCLYYLDLPREPVNVVHKSGAIIRVSQFNTNGNLMLWGFSDGGIIAKAVGDISNPQEPFGTHFSLLSDLRLSMNDDNTEAVALELRKLQGVSRIFHEPRSSDDKRYRNSDGTWNYLGDGAPITRKRILDSLTEIINEADKILLESNEVLILVYISAHGLIGKDVRPYLLPSDADANDQGTWIAYDEVVKYLQSYISKFGIYSEKKLLALIVFDTCQNLSPGVNLIELLLKKQEKLPDNLLVLTATAPGQYSFHWPATLEMEKDTKVLSETRWGFPPPPKAKQGKIKQILERKMSVVPISSTAALDYLAKVKFRQSQGMEYQYITVSEWLDILQQAVEHFLTEIPVKAEAGLDQQIQLNYNQIYDLYIFSIY
jgi:WD40 repeat protein